MSKRYVKRLKLMFRNDGMLPLLLQIEIIQAYQVLFGNPLEISDYFMDFAKLGEKLVITSKSINSRAFAKKLPI